MYNEYQPSLLLAPYIDKYWEFKGNPDYGMKINILPDGCTDFIFTLGEVADIAEQESLIMQPYRSYFVGPMSRYSTLITYAKSIHMFGIRFLPCGLFRFMQLPLEELGNQRISTFESGGIFNDSLAERFIIRKTKCFDFWERNVLFPKTKRSFFRTPTLPFSA